MPGRRTNNPSNAYYGRVSEPPTNGTRPSPRSPEEPAPVARPKRLNLRRLILRFPVSSALTLATLVFFALEYALGGTTDIPAQMRLGAARGDLVFQEDIQEGFENIPETLTRLFTGKNIGKQLLKLADPD